jgi:hypothetical protein
MSFRARLENHLAMCDRHIALGRDSIARQHSTIASLSANGHQTGTAQAVLLCLLAFQRLHEDHREHLLKEIDRWAA